MPRRIGVVTLCVSLALLLGVVASGFATGIADSVYTNDEFDFSIALPSDLADAGWRVFEGEPGVSYAVFEGPEVETITVYVEELAEPVPLEAFVEISLFIFPLIFDDWLQESSLLIEVNGMEGYEVVYTTTIIGIPTRAVEYMFVTETHSFTMSGLFLGDPFPFPLNEFRSIVNTFELDMGPTTDVSPAGSALTQWARLKGARR
ncbi:hypothetical protein HN371_14905 [Candidatus Poribacteria bacterium]|jgi:hypothetical protein|nr:hypothetical protein [Candidatus Poribacteria bacterium]MBT5535962.1 hypothetical protein [Candidatus Poribacteria bacterium]MBT5710638.1 hypothetical protein [Candidatus Poribacteria bacterium]MBT7098196.1 hypothetical protein [Candidatus Poribacteria bacterium]